MGGDAFFSTCSSIFLGNFSPVWLIPSQRMLDLGGDGEKPVWWVVGGERKHKKNCRKSTNPGGKTPKTGGEAPNLPPGGIFSTKVGTGRPWPDPKGQTKCT